MWILNGLCSCLLNSYKAVLNSIRIHLEAEIRRQRIVCNSFEHSYKAFGNIAFPSKREVQYRETRFLQETGFLNGRPLGR